MERFPTPESAEPATSPETPGETLSDIVFAELLPHVAVLEEIGGALDRGEGKRALTMGIRGALSGIAEGTGHTPRTEPFGTGFHQTWERQGRVDGIHSALSEAWDAYERASRINGTLSSRDGYATDGPYRPDEEESSRKMLAYWLHELSREARASRERDEAANRAEQSR